MNQLKGCNDEQLELYHYGELTPIDRQTLEIHLQNCQSCRTSLEELQATLAAVPRPELQFSATQTLQFSAQVTAHTRRRASRYLPVWGGALATGALLVAIVLLHPPDQLVPVVSAGPSMADFEVLEQFDLLQDLDLLENLELLQELETLG